LPLRRQGPVAPARGLARLGPLRAPAGALGGQRAVALGRRLPGLGGVGAGAGEAGPRVVPLALPRCEAVAGRRQILTRRGELALEPLRRVSSAARRAGSPRSPSTSCRSSATRRISSSAPSRRGGDPGDGGAAAVAGLWPGENVA
jgi:hypothetical protein